MVGEEFGHEFEALVGFGEVEVVPESVWHGFEDDEVRIDAGVQEREIVDGGAAEQRVARAGDEKSWRHAVKIGEQRRKNGIFAIGFGDVAVVGAGGGIRGLERAGKTVESEKLARIAGTRIIGEAGEESDGGGKREIQLFEFHGNFGA